MKFTDMGNLKLIIKQAKYEFPMFGEFRTNKPKNYLFGALYDHMGTINKS